MFRALTLDEINAYLYKVPTEGFNDENIDKFAQLFKYLLKADIDNKNNILLNLLKRKIEFYSIRKSSDMFTKYLEKKEFFLARAIEFHEQECTMFKAIVFFFLRRIV